MNFISGLTVYAVLWWGVLYMVLPWKSAPPQTHVPGHATSAPEKPHLRRKFLVTTAISALLWLAVNEMVERGFFRFDGS